VTVPCGAFGQAPCDVGEITVFASFKTGVDPDTTPPDFAGLSSPEAGGFDNCTSSSCCGHYLIRRFRMTWPSASDAGLGWIGALYLGMAVYCSVGNPPDDQSLIGVQDGSYSVRAVDWAGNEDSNAVMATSSTLALAPPAPTAAHATLP
jgi:hypothetical protein